MVIGYEAKRIFHNKSGLGNYSRNLVLSLAQEEPNTKYLLYNYRPGKVEFNAPDCVQEISSNLKNKLAANLWRQRLVSGRAKKDGVEVFHGLAQELPYGLKRKGIKSIVTVHDLIFLRYPKLYKLIDRNIYLKKVKHACKVADLIVAVSSQTRQDLIELLKVPAAKIVVIHQGCDPSFWQEQQNNILPMIKKFGLPERFALFVGTLEPRKNPARVAEVCAKLEIPLVIVGRPTPYWKKFVKNSTTASQAYWQHINVATTRDLATLYAMADVFLYPSIFEGFGIPVLESLASGTPVITGNNSALREVAGPGASLVNVESTKDISKALNSLWQNETLRQKAAEKGTNFAEQFKDSVLAKQWISTYQNVLGA
jgi:glycosyltransferase involved in cell wall biosynthesis